MLLMPRISPRRFFFAITVPPGFRETAAARASLRRYHLWVSVATIVAIGGLAATFATGEATLALWPILPPVVGLAAFLRERAVVRRIAGRPVGAVPEPGWTTLAAVPFLFPLATALYLRSRWDEIPARFPIHWGLHGEPNGWATKTVRGVYGPLAFAGGLMLLILVLALAMYYGSRRGPIRKPVLAMLIAVEYLLGLVFSSVGLMPLVHIPAAVFLVPFVLFLGVVIVWSYRVGTRTPGEATPDECWTLGSIYYNPRDPAIFVQKRIGVGYTFNFGNRIAWVILAAFIGGVVALPLLLLR